MSTARRLTAAQAEDILAAHAGMTVHVRAVGGVDHPGGYYSRDHHRTHRFVGFGCDGQHRRIAYFATTPEGRRWTAVYDLRDIVDLEVPGGRG